MILGVFGGSGATGQHLIELVVTQGEQVRALIRPNSEMDSALSGLTLIRGNLQNPTDVHATLQGCDAVCCVFGPHPPYTEIFCATATKIIIDQMKLLGIQRLVCQTGAMIGDYPRNRSLAFNLMISLAKRRMPELMQDRAEQEAVIRNSGLRWTLIKPSRLTDASPGRTYLAGPEVNIGLFSAIPRADLAGIILSELRAPQFIQQAVFIRTA